MYGKHEWVGEIAPPPAADKRYVIDRCRKCGCLRITDTRSPDLARSYKPAGRTWQPLKDEQTEPSCGCYWPASRCEWSFWRR